MFHTLWEYIRPPGQAGTFFWPLLQCGLVFGTFDPFRERLRCLSPAPVTTAGTSVLCAAQRGTGRTGDPGKGSPAADRGAGRGCWKRKGADRVVTAMTGGEAGKVSATHSAGPGVLASASGAALLPPKAGLPATVRYIGLRVVPAEVPVRFEWVMPAGVTKSVPAHGRAPRTGSLTGSGQSRIVPAWFRREDQRPTRIFRSTVLWKGDGMAKQVTMYSQPG